MDTIAKGFGKHFAQLAVGATIITGLIGAYDAWRQKQQQLRDEMYNLIDAFDDAVIGVLSSIGKLEAYRDPTGETSLRLAEERQERVDQQTIDAMNKSEREMKPYFDKFFRYNPVGLLTSSLEAIEQEYNDYVQKGKDIIARGGPNMGRDLLKNQEEQRKLFEEDIVNIYGFDKGHANRIREFLQNSMDRVKDSIDMQLEIEKLRDKEQKGYIDRLSKVRTTFEKLMGITDVEEIHDRFLADIEKIKERYGGIGNLTEKTRYDLMMKDFELRRNVIVERYKIELEDAKKHAKEMIDAIRDTFDQRKELMRAQLAPLLEMQMVGLRQEFAQLYRGAGGARGLSDLTMENYARAAEDVSRQHETLIAQHIADLLGQMNKDIAAEEAIQNKAILDIETAQHDELRSMGKTLYGTYMLTEQLVSLITNLLVGTETPVAKSARNTMHRKGGPYVGWGNPSTISRQNFNPRADTDKLFENV